ncbi:class I SAM-dependent methyltransferase [Reinekea marina]|uniref:Class I SAM-dependent methyltransferase n=1 Tax=Reinekea marina TaxID=1310421 RepID=A0ABV7WT31_9GAMM|nr:class I SAM-dependent methyltransferase [Reinekea marina]MDN3649764.1 class I SAM-dependent methyltransferase [Reinekea marina]
MNKPEHLSKAIGDQFSDKSVVENYGYRPEYTPDVIQFLSNSLQLENMSVLDVGTGTGEIAIPLAQLGHCVTGVDPSVEMIKAATAKNADVDFKQSYIESFESPQAFDLIVAANSIHWTDWDRAFPALRAVAKPNARFAIITGGDIAIEGLQDEILALVKAFSTTKTFKPYNVVTMLTKGGYIEAPLTTEMPVSLVEQNIDHYISSFHARNGFSLDRMVPEQAEAFDTKLRRLLIKHGFNETVKGTVSYKVTLAELAH